MRVQYRDLHRNRTTGTRDPDPMCQGPRPDVSTHPHGDVVVGSRYTERKLGWLAEGQRAPSDSGTHFEDH